MIDVEQARRLYQGAEAVHDFDHVLRVLALAERLARAEGADLEIVRTAALLHDAARGIRQPITASEGASAAEKPPPSDQVEIAPLRSEPQSGAPRYDEVDGGRARYDEPAGYDHADVGAEMARRLLAGQPPEKVEAVAHAIAAHRFRGGPAPATLEARVLHDADKLDAIGAIGVARAFHYGGHWGQRLWAEVPPDYQESPDTAGEHTPVHEYVFKLARIRERLLTECAREFGEERHAFMVAF
ncbi:MAG: HD domain-containing protein [Anaerolineae bacterium]